MKNQFFVVTYIEIGRGRRQNDSMRLDLFAFGTQRHIVKGLQGVDPLKNLVGMFWPLEKHF